MKAVRPRPPIRAYLLVFAGIFGAAEAPAQSSKFEGQRIISIQFEPQRQPLEPAEIFEMLPLKRNEPLRMAAVRASIQRLYATGRYTEIRAEADPVNGGVLVRFVTENAWFIGKVAVAGEWKEPPNAGQLANATRLDLGRPFIEEQMPNAEEGVRRLLESNGLFNARVIPSLEYDRDTQQVHITFEVQADERARYSAPRITGDPKAPLEKLIDATHWKRWIVGTWKPVTQTRTRSGVDHVRGYYQKQDRLEAKVHLDSIPYNADTGRVEPVLDVQAGPKVEIRTFGADISKKTLRKYLPVYEERTIDHDLLVEGARSLEEYFQSQGHFEAEVEFKQQRVTNDKAVIDYLINTGRKFKLVEVNLAGNKYFDNATLLERMFIRPATLIQFRQGRYSGGLRRRDQETIENLYRANGFRDVRVTAREEQDYKGKEGDVAVFIRVDEGRQYFVSSLQVEGIEKLGADVLDTLSSIEGQPFSETNVAIDRDTILSRYYREGYPDAAFSWETRPGPQPNLVDLRFRITEGQPQAVRQVLISGLEVTRPGLVTQNLNLNPGEPLSPLAMSETQRRLYDLGVFAKVNMAIQNPEGETERKYVVYQMEEASRYSLTTGFGAEIARIGGCQTCLDAPGGAAGFSPRVSVDLTRFNMFGVGHSLSLRTRASNLQRRGVINYSAPRFRNIEGRNLTFTALYDDSRDVRTFSARRQEASIQYSQKLSKATTALGRFSYRRVGVSDLKINPLLVPLLVQPVRIGMLSGNLIQDRRDDPVDPTRGIYNTLDIGVASRQFFGSQRSFSRVLARNATYHRVRGNMILARQTSAGIINAFGDLIDGRRASEAIPFPERFFGGGGASHRGFPENQAGPRDGVSGFPLGGSALLFNNVELRFPLLGENIGGVLFHDAGNVYEDWRDISFRVTQRDERDFNYMVHSVGFGLRYKTPIGPVRADVAWSFNSPRYFGFRGNLQDLLQCGSPGTPACVGEPQRLSRFNFFISIGQTF